MAEAAIISVLTAAATHITKEMINDFRKSNEGEQIWECWPDEAPENWRLIKEERQDDNFPQGLEYILKIQLMLLNISMLEKHPSQYIINFRPQKL